MDFRCHSSGAGEFSPGFLCSLDFGLVAEQQLPLAVTQGLGEEPRSVAMEPEYVRRTGV